MNLFASIVKISNYEKLLKLRTEYKDELDASMAQLHEEQNFNSGLNQNLIKS